MTTAYDDVLEQITQSVFATMLDIEVVRGFEPYVTTDDSIASVVQIRGGWDGGLVIALDPDVARASAASMFRLPAEEVTLEDMQEVAAELANMVGGNVKSVLPGPSSLSLPVNLASADQARNETTGEEVALMTESGPLKVSLYGGPRSSAATQLKG
jgi:chemotaxis protein CheX